ncbi:MAG TPA: TonB-dependent receptor [Casimicrobiaceae bacterium]|nr:TonB-dependent receptor [Casimicrobiaceae bacterium]
MAALAAALGVAVASAQGLPTLVPDAAFEPVVVTAARLAQPVSEVLADVTIIGPEEIARAGQSGVADVLARQPGVEISTNGGPAGSTAVFLRGANGNHTVVLLDGVRIASSTTGTASLEAIPVDQIERIEILRGPASSLYGPDAIGGVIQIFTRRGEQEGARFNASAGYGSYDTEKVSAGVAGGAASWTYALQAGAARSQGFTAIWNPQNFSYNPDRDGYRNGNVSASATWHINADHDLRAQAFDSRLDAQFDESPNVDDRTITTVDSYVLALHDRWTAAWTSRLSAAQTRDDSDSSQSTFGGIFRTRQRLYTWQNELTLPAGVLQLIAERREERVSSDTAFAVTERTTNAAGAIYQLHQGPHDVETVLRYDRSSQFGGETTGTLAYGYRFAPAWRAMVSAGTAFKIPTFNDLYYPGFSNPSLQTEKSRNVEAGLYYTAPEQQARIVAYRNRVRDLIVFECDENFNCLPQNVARATLEGVGLGYDRTWGDTSVKVSVDLQRPEDDATGALLPRRARRHAALFLVHAFGRWRLGVEETASSARFDDPANTRRMGGYALTNLTLEYTFARSWTFFARVNNLFDKRYELVADYNTPRANAFVGVRFQQ